MDSQKEEKAWSAVSYNKKFQNAFRGMYVFVKTTPNFIFTLANIRCSCGARNLFSNFKLGMAGNNFLHRADAYIGSIQYRDRDRYRFDFSELSSIRARYQGFIRGGGGAFRIHSFYYRSDYFLAKDILSSRIDVCKTTIKT